MSNVISPPSFRQSQPYTDSLRFPIKPSHSRVPSVETLRRVRRCTLRRLLIFSVSRIGVPDDVVTFD